jgi:trans-2,3-dihydro-3-hydroxyanthranilate isomerase
MQADRKMGDDKHDAARHADGPAATGVVEPSVTFALVDVFADRPLTGNPLAVVPDADWLDIEQMRRIARELNQVETTFLLAPRRADADRRLRSFTAAGAEVEGAGHNALGAWLWLAATGALDHEIVSTWSQEIGGDVLAVEITRRGDQDILVTMDQSAPRFGPALVDRRPLLSSLGLDEQDLDPSLPTQVVDTGAGHLLVALADPGILDRVVVDQHALRDVLRLAGGEGCYVYAAPPNSDDVQAYARFFNPTMGIVEDPATGTAAGPLAAALVRHGRVKPADVVIMQGQAIGRPSRLRVHVAGDRVRLSGSGIVSGRGTLRV